MDSVFQSPERRAICVFTAGLQQRSAYFAIFVGGFIEVLPALDTVQNHFGEKTVAATAEWA